MSKKVIIWWVIILIQCLIFVIISGCGASENKTATGTKIELVDSESMDFELTDLSDHRVTEGLAFKIVESADRVDVAISTNDSTGDAFGSLKFDANQYTPVETAWNESLLDGQSVYLALANQPGEVPFGIVRLPDANGIDGNILTIAFTRQTQSVSRRISKAPQGEGNTVSDLVALPQQDGTVDLEWSEQNIGDYDNSGEVGVADITPIALNYLAVLGDGQGDEDWEKIIDGDGSGDIGIPDITPIASNYLSVVAGYRVYRGIELQDGEVNWEAIPIKTIPRPVVSVMKRIGYKTSDNPLGGGQ